MSWTVYSRTDPTRWFSYQDGETFGDDMTLALLADPDVSYMLTPVGPARTGIRNESDMLAAVMYSIPATSTAGDLPDFPKLPHRDGPIVH